MASEQCYALRLVRWTTRDGRLDSPTVSYAVCKYILLNAWYMTRWVEIDISWERVIELGYHHLPQMSFWAERYPADDDPSSLGV